MTLSFEVRKWHYNDRLTTELLYVALFLFVSKRRRYNNASL
jgi:hypothetical protein